MSVSSSIFDESDWSDGEDAADESDDGGGLCIVYSIIVYSIKNMVLSSILF